MENRWKKPCRREYHLCRAKKRKWLSPSVGLEPTTLRLRVSRSTDWANRASSLMLDIYPTHLILSSSPYLIHLATLGEAVCHPHGREWVLHHWLLPCSLFCSVSLLACLLALLKHLCLLCVSSPVGMYVLGQSNQSIHTRESWVPFLITYLYNGILKAQTANALIFYDMIDRAYFPEESPKILGWVNELTVRGNGNNGGFYLGIPSKRYKRNATKVGYHSSADRGFDVHIS